MINLLIPLVAVAFSFVVSLILDFRQSGKVLLSRLRDHATQAGIYLACIGVGELMLTQRPDLAVYIRAAALTFALSEFLQTFNQIRTQLGANNPISQALDSVQQQIPQMPPAALQQVVAAEVQATQQDKQQTPQTQAQAPTTQPGPFDILRG